MGPLLLASLIATGAGAGLNMLADRKVEKEKKSKFRAEAARQDEMRGRAKQRFNELLTTQTPEAQGDLLNTQQQQLGDYYAGDNSDSDYTAMLPGQGEASDAVRTEIVDTQTKGSAKADRMSRRLANLDAMKGVQLKNQTGFRDTKQNIAQIGAESRRSSDILPLELQEAENAGGGLRMLGGLASFGGQVAGMASAAGVGGPPQLTGLEAGANGPNYVWTKPGFFKDTLIKSRFPLEPRYFPVK